MIIRCSKCKIEKENIYFSKNRNSKTGHHNQCKECRKIYNDKRAKPQRHGEYLKYRGKWKDTTLRAKYGITLEDYDKRRIQQEFKCKICQIHEEDSPGHGLLHVDHCHIKGDIRGLLCSKCNIGLGHFSDNPELLEKAKTYLLGG